MTETFILLASLLASEPLTPGDHARFVSVDDVRRPYLVHVPPDYDPATPTPVVLVLHGAGTNDAITVRITGMNKKADEAGFIAVYPNGTGRGPFLTWNAGARRGRLAEKLPDDVKYIASVLDDVESVINVDKKRVFATGMSNGGMMCYRLAAELSDRIAAIAPVAGTMAIDDPQPIRPVPVMHFHGMADLIVPPDGPLRSSPGFVKFKSVNETIETWCQINGCQKDPVITAEPDRAEDGTSVTRRYYGPGKNGAEVVLFEIEGGGHTWPGRPAPLRLIGLSTRDISANDLIWEFFQKHPLE